MRRPVTLAGCTQVSGKTHGGKKGESEPKTGVHRTGSVKGVKLEVPSIESGGRQHQGECANRGAEVPPSGLMSRGPSNAAFPEGVDARPIARATFQEYCALV